MVGRATAYLALMALTGPVAAQGTALIRECAGAELGSAACGEAELATALGRLEAQDVRMFREAGMESFALLTSLRYASSALSFALDDEPCAAIEEMYAAEDIWTEWVRLPEAAPEDVTAQFRIYEAVMDKVLGTEVVC